MNCVVTSPPYWGLRDYGLGDSGIGLESTPQSYIESLRAVFAELWRVLRKDGTVWLNLGDSYAGSGKGGGSGYTSRKQTTNVGSYSPVTEGRHFDYDLKQKQLCGIPWRVALALQAEGWWLRSDIVWAKPNPMPESVTDRPTRSHEYIFLLTKSERYWYDADAIKEPGIYAGPNRTQKTPYDQGFGRRTPEQERIRQDKQRGHSRRHAGFNDRWDAMTREEQCNVMRNKRSVWTVATQPYSGSHFATFPEKLIEPCILAGCPKGGIVLDPFVGSGTTVRVATRLNRIGIGCDLTYQHLAVERTRLVQRELLA